VSKESHVGWGVFARLRRHDRRFSDEQIFTILRTGEAGGPELAELCAASGVTLPMYCLWKARYGQLTYPELRSLRRQEGRQALIVRASLVTVMVLGACGVGLLVIPNWTPNPASAGTVRAVTAPGSDSPGSPDSPGFPDSAHSPEPALALASTPAVAMTPSGHVRYEVQVAAEPDLRAARTIAGRLEAAGYAAYVLPAMVDAVELYRVRIGPFESRDDAREIVRLLERDGYEGPWIAK
jgi:hypothetical protein